MKILYDHQIFQHQRVGGISRYFTEIIRHLPPEVEAEVSAQYSFNEHLKTTDIPVQYVYQLENKFRPDIRIRRRRLLTPYMERFFPNKYPNRYEINKQTTIEKIKKGNFDVFHPTFFEDYYLDFIGDKPFVLTVHDMIVELFPEFYSAAGFMKRQQTLVDRAAHIIAVSENTKQDLVNFFETDPDKISVTYHASSLSQPLSSNHNLVLPERYILYVGDRAGYKNFLFFVTSLIPTLNKYPDLKIVCVGTPFIQSEQTFFETLGISNRIEQHRIPDADMFEGYSRAQVFVYPSCYEGFGIPILEAFQANCPVVLSDASCFREVAGDAALYFELKNPKALRQGVEAFLSSEQRRSEYITRGKAQLNKYSWAKSAQDTVNIYQKVLGK